MLIHIVCWKYRPDVDADKRQEHIDRLRSLSGLIDGLLELKVGKDILSLERSFDTGLFARFTDLTALQAYTDHPRHVEAAAMGRAIAERVVSVDMIDEE